MEQFNDLPVNLRGNVIQTAPFGLQPGDPPRLTAADTADLVAFLRTLTDDALLSDVKFSDPFPR